jgi:hypothetical protein
MFLFVLTTLLVLSTAGATINSCLSSANLDPVFPSSSVYAADTLAYNHRLAYKPAAVVYPSTVQDVAKAVECASQAGIKVAARSGGHSYAANGIGGQDGSLVVDLKNIKSIQVSSSTQTAVFGTGIRLGDLALALYNGGHQAIAHGTCPYVGTGGHLGCGGFGFPSRMWGLALDAVIAAQVVLANGTLVTASNSQNQDVFFAIRGAAPSFGIVTSITIKTQPAPSSNILFQYVFDASNTAIAVQTFLAYQNFGANSAPPQLGIQVELDSGYFSVSGVYYGTKTQFNAAIKPFLAAVPKAPTSSSTKTYDWLGILTQLAGSDGSLNTSTKPDESDTFYAKSLVVDENAPLTEAALTSFFTYLNGPGVKSDTSWFIEADLWGGPNSAVNAVSSTASAFAQRSALYTFQIYASSSNNAPPYPTDGISFVDGIVNSITSKMPNTQFGGYSCYVDPQLSAADAHKAYYADNLPRLQSIKTSVDPDNTFSFPQAIGQ